LKRHQNRPALPGVDSLEREDHIGVRRLRQQARPITNSNRCLKDERREANEGDRRGKVDVRLERKRV
jgi:hypothetical protein